MLLLRLERFAIYRARSKSCKFGVICLSTVFNVQHVQHVRLVDPVLVETKMDDFAEYIQ